jgi:S-methylmethionine-dependent homocysteine/selenocysteine methylase
MSVLLHGQLRPPCPPRPRAGRAGPWRQRIAGLRYNASAKSHAELDQASGLDDGNPQLLAGQHAQLAPLLPPVPVLGGCCGTDTRHVAALWGAGPPPRHDTP